MKLSVTGLNHNTAPVEIRERLAFSEAALPAALADLTRAGFSEGLILSTCNRVEIAVAVGEDSDPGAGVNRFLAEARGMDSGAMEPYFYRYEGRDAVRHLFRVAASLDSMILGEPQILGQLKAAYAVAKAHGTLGGLLDTVLTRAFSVAKRVRSETEIGQNAVSVSFAAVELAREIFGSLDGKKVMIVGAGKMSELAARHLRSSGVSEIYVTNRTYERAVAVASRFQGWLVDYHSFKTTLPHVDILIASSAAPHYILTTEDMRQVIRARRNRPMFLIDIAVPRNIEPAVNQIDNVFLYDIDDLRKVVDSNIEGRRKSAAEAEAIVEQEVDRLEARLKAREIAPTIASLQAQLEQVRVAEMERLRGRLGPLSPQQEEAVEALTRGIINKIAHGPISELRRYVAHPDGVHVIETIRRVFRIGD